MFVGVFHSSLDPNVCSLINGLHPLMDSSLMTLLGGDGGRVWGPAGVSRSLEACPRAFNVPN